MLRRATLVMWDYPRVGGEESKSTASVRFGRGITPAWAGKSHEAGHARHQTRDYPRVGGEEQEKQRQNVREEGLPPRGRGRESMRLGNGLTVRITPAWAGKRQ